MMQFFRTYQRYFFIALTIIIIISFSFFGAYNSLATAETHDPVVFTAVNGKDITKSQVDAFMRFISTDVSDKILSGGSWGPNFLNDGVVKKDFLETGLALTVVKPFLKELGDDLDARLEKEKRYEPYVHPTASFLTSEAVWNYLAPQINKNMQIIQTSEAILTEDTFNAQVQLYLEEKKFPSQYLRQVLRYQETEYSWIQQDPSLASRDLNLFGHRTLEEWFGPRFLELTSQVVMNLAAIAESQGLVVTDSDALADLFYNNEISFRQLQKAQSVHLGVRNPHEYFQEQLRILGMDQKAAVDIWKQVMLFRLLANRGSSAVFVDPLVYEQFDEYAGKSVDLSLYAMEEPLRFSKARDLQKLDTYFLGITGKEAKMDVPLKFMDVNEIKKSASELVQKNYVLSVKKVSLKDLQVKVTLKQAINYELEDKNWPELITRFAELGTNVNATREERFDALERLGLKKRALVDEYAKLSIIKMHPEWVDDALENAESEDVKIAIKEKGATLPFEGIEDIKAFQVHLDKAVLSGSGEANVVLMRFSQDEEHYYSFTVLKRDSTASVMTFEEANNNKTLDKLLDARLEKAYLALQNKDTSAFKDPSGKLKKFAEVKDAVADVVFASLYDQLIEYAKSHGYPWHEATGISRGDFAAQMRFLDYIKGIKTEVIAGNNDRVAEKDLSTLVSAFEAGVDGSTLQEQFKVQKNSLTVSRSSEGHFDAEAFLKIEKGAYSDVLFLPKEGSFFVSVVDINNQEKDVVSLMKKGQKLLQDESSIAYMQDCLNIMLNKQAIKLIPLSSLNAEGLVATVE
ncbi:MAG: hypothetical protein P4L16_07025 [Chlamydiales bacterium]|nr:hypothetical protein [Chlamydiales bacterium]